MSALPSPLLPPGFYDLLPEQARTEFHALIRLMDVFESFGYAQVEPPLLEYESSLLAGRGAALSADTFRLMDNVSHQMMGLRPDITLQIARIAATRLVQMPRPLRLCYKGMIVRRQAEALSHERQITEAGIELIGSQDWQCDAEVMIVAIAALAALGVDNVTLDIHLPALLARLCPEATDSPELKTQIAQAVSRKDSAMARSLPVAAASELGVLIASSGAWQHALAPLRTISPQDATRLEHICSRLVDYHPTLALTLDPLEYHGFSYHDGVSFSLFTPSIRQEIGRGGHYYTGHEAASGFTLYVSRLLPLIPPRENRSRVLVTSDCTAVELRTLQEKGYATVMAHGSEPHAEAKASQIPYLYEKGQLVKL